MKKNEPGKHHIVPEVYLKNFTKKNGKLFKLRIDLLKRPKPKELHPSAVCYKYNFYKFENKIPLGYDLPIDNNILENRGFLYENKLGKLINKIINPEIPVTFQEAFEFSIALFDIKMRNERIRNISLSKKTINETFDNLLKKHSENPELLEPLLERSGVDFNRFLELFENIRYVWTTNESIKKDLHNKFLLDSKIDPSPTKKLIIERLVTGDWILLKTTLNYQFITSDNPGYCQDENNQVHNTKFEGNFNFFFPLTPYHLLLIRAPKENLAQIPVYKNVRSVFAQKDEVKEINQKTTLIANREIYAAYENPLLQTWYAINAPFIIT